MGEVTNNIAEYEGVARAMQHAIDHVEVEARYCFRVDSLLVAKQI